jgi:hypothetical protein
VPTRDGVLGFFANQLVVNAVAWTAALTAAGLVGRFFEVRSFRNLWGLTASSHRSLVSAEAYRLIMSLASYSVGLVMLILVRHLILRSLAELRLLRRERSHADGRSILPQRAPNPAAGRGRAEPLDPTLIDSRDD